MKLSTANISISVALRNRQAGVDSHSHSHAQELLPGLPGTLPSSAFLPREKPDS